jgi:N-acetylglucosaminyldiphosphoundecaprenol N-acetyl-beta-D-mannosaminyltransferase
MSVSMPPTSAGAGARRLRIANIWLDALTEAEVIAMVRASWAEGRGGSITTVNVDVARAVAGDPELADLVEKGTLVVADGMPLIWASRVAGDVLPERVPGSTLVLTLSEAAASDGKSVFVLGGDAGVPEKAAEALAARYPGLRIAGTDSPPFGFDQTAEGVERAVATVLATAPDLVFVGLGFPKQERLIEHLRLALPGAWFVACGGGIAMAAGVFRRASPTAQRLGLEWAHRLVLEPRRLARRYLRDDLPFALALMARSAGRRFARGPSTRQAAPARPPEQHAERLPASHLGAAQQVVKHDD